MPQVSAREVQQEDGPIHAVATELNGKRVAVAGNKVIRIWPIAVGDVKAACHPPIAELTGHEGLVWTVSWAHPIFGSLLASAGEDRFLLIWREEEGEWKNVHRHPLDCSVMAAAFGPWEYGLQLAIATSDGCFQVLQSSNSEPLSWSVEHFAGVAHEGGTFAICWAPATAMNVSEFANCRTLGPRRLVTGGADCQVCIWRHDALTGQWENQHHFRSGEHVDIVRDVAWRPNLGIAENTIASCAEDGSVVVWTQMSGQPWRLLMKWKLDGVAAWQVSWSATGSMLAVSTSKGKVLIYQAKAEGGRWEEVQSFDEQSAPDLLSGH
eukprot:NODE_12374_length_1228_cov_10.443233.p1 GENE.NODE_12374_length_1228_cov_10.443233~~NODE_12374_length_1228_cov_10.443233.p1  ORF type:complete len:323 (-),score=40.88 NODE_12374_length_1228_cov_10.443233:42-1010(-)